MKTYPFNELNATKLREIASVHYELPEPGVWEELARRGIGERERTALVPILAKIRDLRLHLANEATIWARAIYPLLTLAERKGIFAFAGVPLVTIGSLKVTSTVETLVFRGLGVTGPIDVMVT